VFCLEYKHIVKSTRDTKRHTIGERSLTERIDEEDSSCSGNRCAIGNTDPGTHTQAVGKFPLTTHVAEDADEEVEDYQLIGTTIVEPLIERSSFPNGIEVKSDCVRRGYNSTRNDVVTVEKGTSNGFADAVDVHRRSSDEGNDEAYSCSKQGGDHQDTEPTDIQTVISAGYPVAELFPSVIRL